MVASSFYNLVNSSSKAVASCSNVSGSAEHIAHIAQRLAIIALFSIGLFVVVAAAIRIYYLDIVLRQTYDVTWEGAHLWSWVAVEANLGIICGCVPWLKSLVKSRRTERAGPGRSGGNGGSGSARNRPHPGAVPTIGSGCGMFKMDCLAKGSSEASVLAGPEDGEAVGLATGLALAASALHGALGIRAFFGGRGEGRAAVALESGSHVSSVLLMIPSSNRITCEPYSTPNHW